MAASPSVNTQYTSSEYVESAGAILFHLSRKQICLVHSTERDEWLLPKGRRNIGETRQKAAAREVQEETGFPCRLLPVNLKSRCTPDAEETGFTPDEPRLFENVTEPFMLTHRIPPGDQGMKLIWWFIAAIDEDAPLLKGEDIFTPKLFEFEDALSALKFADDRDIVARATEVFEATYHT